MPASLPPQGALLAFECLSEKLGKLFEPYIIYILPLLLACFGDVVPVVRQATEDASRMIMGQLTASGRVRQATEDASRMIMGQLTASGRECSILHKAIIP